MGGDFPSKPMSLYATIWMLLLEPTADATHQLQVLSYVAEFAELVLHGCAVDPIGCLSTCRDEEAEVVQLHLHHARATDGDGGSEEEAHGYSYCYDEERYPSPPPECVANAREAEQFAGAGSGRSGYRRRGHGKRHRKPPAADATF
ncbi:hypothetical protein HPP92_010988 [Vanilla planifolia]|uniref:Uncharacterized protein n=1 Tax=Vanilla planifolia TaxID=51239 RepID=A0A835V1D0_VANPL|nr:hypothetical protein HPP92_010988 [Vanilla planifolia]